MHFSGHYISPKNFTYPILAVLFTLFASLHPLQAEDVPEIQAPSFSHEPGFYTGSFDLSLETPHDGIYQYSLSRAGYHTVQGEVHLVSHDLEVHIVMAPTGKGAGQDSDPHRSFQVNFQVDMSDSPYQPGDVIYISGTMSDPSWPEPGSNPDMALEAIDGEGSVYGISFQLSPGEYAYKYFLNEGWGGGEWSGDPNRVVEVWSGTTFHDTWGVIDPDNGDPGDPDDPGTFSVSFIVQDPEGQPIDDAVLTFDGQTYQAGHYTIPHVLPEAVIRYTTDGSIPDAESPLFTSPIAITDRSGEPNSISMIPTNNLSPGHQYNEHWQPPAGELFKINSIRARAFLPNGRGGEVATKSFIVHEEAHQRYSMPVIAINAPAEALFHPDSGIYVYGNHQNYFQRGIEWERLVHFELFEKDGGLSVSQQMGARIHGGTSRNRPRKSLRMYARSDYGTTWLDYPLFPDKEIPRYKRFLLRNSGNDWGDAIFRDAFMQSLLKELDLDIQYTRPVILFINGEYWGVHNIRDRLDNRYLETHYGLDDEMTYTILERHGEFDRGNPAGVQHYFDMLDYLESPGVSEPVHFQEIQTRMDIHNFTDYQVAQIYVMNTDWPGNNIQFWRYYTDTYDPDAPRGLDGLWRWQVFDLDFGFGLNFDYVTGVEEGPAHNTLAFAMESNGPPWPNPPWSTFIFRKLLENNDYKHHFITRFADLLNTLFREEHVQDQLDAFHALYLPEMPEHIHRWRMPATMDHWQSEVDVMHDFAAQRPGYMREHLREAFDLGEEVELHVEVVNPSQGRVRVNTIKTPRGSGLWSGTYFEGLPLELEAVPAPGYRFSHWEGLPESTAPLQVLVPEGESSVTAHFQDGLIHYWHFNNLPDGVLQIVPADYSLEEGALITYPGTGGQMDRSDGTRLNASHDTSAGYGLRTRNPSSERYLQIHAPSVGHRDLVLSFAAHRTPNGARQQQLYYSPDAGEQWIAFEGPYDIGPDYAVYRFDLTSVEAVNDNPGLRFRIEFLGEEASGQDGNNRFDNISLSGNGTWLRLGKRQPATAYRGEAYGGHYFSASGGTPPYQFTLSAGNIPPGMHLSDKGHLAGTPENAGSYFFTITVDDGNKNQASRDFQLQVEEEVLVHYWHFNDLAEGTIYLSEADHSLTPARGTISYPGSGEGYMDRSDGSTLGAQQGEGAGYALRVRNPSHSRQLVLSVPSTGFEELKLTYAVHRTSNGARHHQPQYSPDGGVTWHDIGPPLEVETGYQLRQVDLSGFEDAVNNPYLAVRLLFMGAEASGDSGNNRFDNISVRGNRSSVSIQETGSRTRLDQNYPNPFRQHTTIPFYLERPGHVRVDVFNLQGVHQGVILDQHMPAGEQRLSFDARGLPPGAYIYRVRYGGQVESRLMLLIR